MGDPASDQLWAGIDLGTQSVRVVIVDDGGTVLALGAAALESRRSAAPDRHHEQDPRQWWAAIGEAARQAFASLPPPVIRRPVGALAICSTSGTIALTDASGAAVSQALMYDDARAVDELARINNSVHHGGGPDVQLSWALPKIGWLLRRRHPDKAVRYVAHSADVVAAALVGHRVCTDNSHALKSGYDLQHDRWDHQLMEAAGVDPAVLPDVVRPGTPLGVVTPRAAAHTGIPAGTPVVAGMTDGCAAQIAAGALSPGSWNSVLGTTLVLKGVSERLIDVAGGSVYSHRHPDGGWLPGGASNVGAGVLADEFPDADLDALSVAASGFEPASAVVYPLTAPGERFPFVRPDAVRFQAGDPGGPGERFAALLQGVAFVERLCFEHLAALGADTSGDIAITGGGTRNVYWNQLRADVLGRPLVLPATPEPAFGMAVLASARHDAVTARAAGMVSRRGVVQPRPGGHERLSAGYVRLVAELVDRGYVEHDVADREWSTP
ncbi:FGGY-family carbohydrate kinase [Phytoactinopolyspora limicola]|uniref:FGGY-family carbohydrate kinase n=1 Tax=Phytoactinopolyspora limicola TaxID=2715536 RepID=UPI001A9C6A10|nr:FGGY family carbohydrate kinase [Phytoactinopolyspora limicola]